MNALLLVVVLAGVQSEGALTPPPMPPPVEVQPAPQHTPPPRSDAPMRGTSPKREQVRVDNGGRIGAGVSLLAVGYAASIVNTSVYWFTDGVRQWSFLALVGIPLGIIVSAIPVAGPLVALVSDLASQQWNQQNFAIRTIVNLASLAMQATGLVLLVTMPRAPKRDAFAVTGFGASPVEGGAVVGLGGRFDFPY